MKMEFQINGFGYSYYIGIDKGKKVYNIVPTDSKAPTGGYYSKDYILNIKKAPDLFGNLTTINHL